MFRKDISIREFKYECHKEENEVMLTGLDNRISQGQHKGRIDLDKFS